MAETTLHTIPAEGSSLLAADFRNLGILKKRWLYHPLFWVLYYGLTIVLYLSLHEKLNFASHIMTAIMVLFQAGFCYLYLYVIIPRLLFNRKYFYYTLCLIGVLTLCPLLAGLAENAYVVYIEHYPKDKIPVISLGRWTVGVIQCIYVLGLVTGIKFVKDTLINQQVQKEREKHYLETELKFLRTQIQPHFFFNTLNNIYSLTLKKSDQAPDIILKLSDLMSYMLYESTAPLVPLTKEIDYLRNYLDVEQLRFGSRLTISFTIEGLTTGIDIPPMILILFLENSFKHGVKNNISNILLTIRLRVADGYLFFHVENPAPEEEKDVDTRGIGLKNVRRRLDLLYGDRHSLDIHEENRLFIVSLKMPLC
ncbi:MAG TPA: histidine kinase [Puia sp.]|nr:histidine kinase [Puia sp.]